ncbi:recombinase family protein [Actinacidiphila glaucinigra]|uniref:recombinase family protein n=1 Tax=Actinacidiphila glaucinigra TaxID=235986 RepID=UPI0035DDAC67
MPISPEFLHMVYPGVIECVLYGRASRDPRKKGRSVKSQLGEGRRFCAEYNLPIVREFSDIDRSASAYARLARDEFEEMLDFIESGGCRMVIAFEASRYYRDLEAYVRLRNVCIKAGVLLCYNGQVYDLSKAADRKATAQDALQAEGEADAIRERNLRTVRDNAREGRPHGRLLDGYTRRYDPQTGDLVDQVRHPDRAPLIEGIFRAIAANRPIRRVRIELNANPKTWNQHGRRWTDNRIKDIIRNPGYLGRRVFQGQDIGKAAWPPISEESDFEQIFNAANAILDAPDRRTTRDSTPAHLLSNIPECGECDDHPRMRSTWLAKVHKYSCSERFDVTVDGRMLEGFVEHAVLLWLRSDRAAQAFNSQDGERKTEAARRRLANFEGQLEEARRLASTYDEETGVPLLSVVSLAQQEKELSPRIAKARADIKAAAVPPLLQGLVGRADADDRWEDLDLAQKRAILRLIVRIRVHKARSRGVRRIEPGRVSLLWFGEEGFEPMPARAVRGG